MDYDIKHHKKSLLEGLDFLKFGLLKHLYVTYLRASYKENVNMAARAHP